MRKFINMDFDGSQWWVEYIEDGTTKKDYFNSEVDSVSFYNSFF
jgi:hypothetical protein